MGRRLEEASPGSFERSAEAVRPGDLASIIYTSGTTGLPKGVMLSHANFVSNVLSLTEVIDFCATDTALSFLPLSHVLERTATFFLFHVGAAIAYAESIETVAANMVEVRPTIVVSVPRLFEKIYSRIMDQVMAGSRLEAGDLRLGPGDGKKYAARIIARRPVPSHLAFKRGLARQARLLQDHGPDGRPDPVLHLRRGAALEGHRRVLLRHRPHRPAGLRADRDLAVLTANTPTTDPVRDRGQGRSPGSSSASPRTARSWPAAPTS